MPKKEIPIELQINKKSVKVVIISLIFVIVIAILAWTAITDILGIEMNWIGKILILIIAIDFMFNRIITPLSEKLLKVFAKMSQGKKMMESLEEFIPQEKEINTKTTE